MEIAFLPHRLLDCLAIEPRTQLALNYAMSAMLLLVLFAVSASERGLSLIPHVCLMQWLLSKPCPGCGITTSLFALSHHHFDLAWQANPAGRYLPYTWFYNRYSER